MPPTPGILPGLALLRALKKTFSKHLSGRKQATANSMIFERLSRQQHNLTSRQWLN
jgi:hypothetical protein